MGSFVVSHQSPARGSRTPERGLACLAFTVGHSLSLALVGLGLIQLPLGLIEATMPLSIAYVALGNVLLQQAGMRWRESALFGLVHGAAFATVLQNLGWERAQILWPLLSFNLGIEAGQLIVIAAVFPALLWLRRLSQGTHLVKALNLGIFLLSMSLFFRRV